MRSVNDETTLLAQARLGGSRGARAFSELVALHHGDLLRFLVPLLGSVVDAEEVAQETYVRFWTSLAAYRGEASVRTWLRVLATRLAYNYVRSTRPREVLALDPLLPAESRVQPAAGLAYESADAVGHTLATLEYSDREILLLHHVDDLPVEEIATVLDLGVSAVKMRLKRSRERFLAVFQRDT